MRRLKLDRVYESATKPEDTNVLWADVDESTGKLRAIHKFNHGKGEWEPYLVGVDYIKPEEEEEEEKEEE